jgi:KDO2-lipid IV(A) lauroyltransferase
MPQPLARRQFDLLADAAWARHGKGVRRLESNLRRVLGPTASGEHVRRVTHLGMRSYFRYWCEVFQLPRMKTADIVARMHVDGDSRIRDGYAAGNGLILVLPHTGNWDHAGAWLAATGVPFTTVAERLEPESLFERFVEFRKSLGMEVIPLTGGERPPYDVLADRLRAGGALCLLGDRDLTSTGIDVDFFGAQARMPAGPAALAHDTGAVLLPVTLSYPNRTDWAARIHPQVFVPESGDRAQRIQLMTQHVADAFAEGIADHPQDWHMLQRVWVDDLDANRLPDGAAPVTAR